MQKIFNRILIPVNFSRNTSLVMDKAVEVANKFHCDILLLHVVTPGRIIPYLYDGYLTGTFIKSSMEEAEEKAALLKQEYRSMLNDGLQLSSLVVMGSWQVSMKETIIAQHIDLVIIPKYRKMYGTALIRRININKLSLQTQCPVLTVTRSFNINHLLNIVVPINDYVPVRKLALATYLAREVNGNIHLMAVGGNLPARKTGKKYLFKAYRLLSDYSTINIRCAMPGDDSAASTLAYARNVKADLIVVNTGKESRLRGWWNKLMGKYLYKESGIPVLTIASQQAEQFHLQ